MTSETLTPCDGKCGGWVCAFHGLPQEAQDEITSLRKRLEEAEKFAALDMATVRWYEIVEAWLEIRKALGMGAYFKERLDNHSDEPGPPKLHEGDL